MRAVLAYWPVLAGIVAAIAAVFALRRRRDRAMEHGRAAVKPRTRSSIAAAYDQATKQLAKHGTRREAGVTPRELANRAVATGAPAAAELSELTELYYKAEWGGRSDPAAEARAHELAIAIRNRLRAAEKSAPDRKTSLPA